MKLGFSLGPCVRDILLDNVKDEDIAFILVDEFFSWNSHPDDSKSVIQNNIIEWWWWDEKKSQQLKKARNSGSPLQ